MITMKDMGNDIIEVFILDDDKCYIGKDRYYVKGDKAELLTCSRLKSGKIRKMVSFYPDDLNIYCHMGMEIYLETMLIVRIALITAVWRMKLSYQDMNRK